MGYNSVYKYRDWKKPNHKTIITKRELYFAPPSLFSDQKDCRNLVCYNGLDDIDIYNICYYWEKEKNPKMPHEEIHKKALQLRNTTLIKDKDYVARRQEEEFQEFDRCSGVISLSNNPQSLRMWNDYADSHQGFVVEFNKSFFMPPFCTIIGDVNYCAKLPVFYPEPLSDLDTKIAAQIFSKLDSYQFEDEVRVFKFNLSGLDRDDRKIQLPPEAFTKIIIGEDMPQEDRDDLLRSIPDELSSVPVEYAVKGTMS